MKLTLQLQLLPAPDQKADLLATMERFNEAATFAARVGFDAGVYGQVTIHKLAYHEIRKRFGIWSSSRCGPSPRPWSASSGTSRSVPSQIPLGHLL